MNRPIYSRDRSSSKRCTLMRQAQRLFPVLRWMLAALLMMGCGSEPPKPSENLIQPPIATGALPETWTPFSVPPNKYTTVSTTKGHSGEPAIEVKGEGERGGVLMNSLPTRSGESYAMDGWIEMTGDESAIATIKLDWVKKNGEPLTACSGQITAMNRGWQRVALQTPPTTSSDETPSLRMALVLAGRGTARFSGLDLRTVASAPSTATNLLRDGGMENVVGHKFKGWQLVHSQKTKCEMTPQDQNPHSGKFCLQIKGGGEWAVATSPRMTVDVNKKYVLRGFARRTVGKALIKLDLYKDDKVEHSETSASAVLDEWEQLEVTVGPGQLQGFQQLAVGIVARGNEMDACFDDLTLQIITP